MDILAQFTALALGSALCVTTSRSSCNPHAVLRTITAFSLSESVPRLGCAVTQLPRSWLTNCCARNYRTLPDQPIPLLLYQEKRKNTHTQPSLGMPSCSGRLINFSRRSSALGSHALIHSSLPYLLVCLISFMSIHKCKMPLFLIGVFVTLVVAQQNSKDPLTDFCRRHQHQTCVIDSKLYIDGGLVYYGTSVTPDSQPERSERVPTSYLTSTDHTDTWLLWGDLADLSAGTPPLYKNLTKVRLHPGA